MVPLVRNPMYFKDGAAISDGIRDGQPVTKFRCPVCHTWGDIDDDQLHGRVSIDHSGTVIHRAEGVITCTYHETRDIWSEFTTSKEQP